MRKEVHNNSRLVRIGIYLAIGLTVAAAIWYLYRGLSQLL